MPSNRPQTIIGPDPAASSTTRDWVNGRPRGLISRRGRSFGQSEQTSAASIAAASTSARSTMPGPPPAGVSSTLRCRSVAESLMSRASRAQRPNASALPARLTPSGPGNISGNSVSTVACQILGVEVMPSNGASSRGRQTGCSASSEYRSRACVPDLRLATIFGEFEAVVFPQMLVGSNDRSAFNPMVDGRCVPGLGRDLVFPGRVVDVLRCKAGFDFERLERPGLGSHGFLADDL